MKKYSILIIVGLLVALASTADAAPKAAKKKPAQQTPAAGRDQQKLVALLRSDAKPADKALACKQLALCGDAEAVPALADLLGDAELAAWSRIALEAIPDTAVDDALRAALGRLHGRLLVGVINSLGVRGDTKSVDTLIPRLNDADADVAAAAAVALGRIGTAAALEKIEAALSTGPVQVRSAAAEGCILCAERFLAQNSPAEAAKIYDIVRGKDLPQTRIREATRGAIIARGPQGVPLLLEQLRSADKQRFNLGLRVARELPGREATDALLAELPKAEGPRRGLLVLALADRGEPRVLPAVLQAAKSGDEQLQILAMRALKRVGDATCAAALLDAAVAPSAEVSQTAVDVLAELRGTAVDEAVVARLSASEGKTRIVLLEVAGRRHIAAASPALWSSADDKDAAVRAAALAALGEVIDTAELPKLIARLAGTKDEQEAVALDRALRQVCRRSADHDACAEKLAAALPTAGAALKTKILETLSVTGGQKALAAVAAAARSSDEPLRDAAYRVLGQWMSVDAGPVLLDLCKSAGEEKLKVRAIRAYIRIARQFTMPAAERVAMCRTALQTAQRDEDKRLVLEILLRYPSPEMLDLAMEAEKIPALKDEAAVVAMGIARGQGGNPAELRKALAQAGHKAVKLEILKAEYGAGSDVKDVTVIVRRAAKNYRVIFLPSASYNECFGGDPAPGVVKQLKIKYRIDGKEGEATLAENATVVLPLPR